MSDINCFACKNYPAVIMVETDIYIPGLNKTIWSEIKVCMLCHDKLTKDDA